MGSQELNGAIVQSVGFPADVAFSVVFQNEGVNGLPSEFDHRTFIDKGACWRVGYSHSNARDVVGLLPGGIIDVGLAFILIPFRSPERGFGPGRLFVEDMAGRCPVHQVRRAEDGVIGSPFRRGAGDIVGRAIAYNGWIGYISVNDRIGEIAGLLGESATGKEADSQDTDVSSDMFHV